MAENSYGDTICLPKTSFPMRAKLPQLEEKLLSRWRQMDLWRLIRDASKGQKKFILHDGPPYANGGLHMGHVLNKVLKDVIGKSQQMMGNDANYVPGWDCHGLPIEWLIEEKFRKEGRDRSSIDVLEFRKACRDSALYWMGVQSEGFQRLGVFGDWANPYSTMSFDAEASTVAEIGKFLLSGSLYCGVRPVQWSVVEQTTLADAETEYHEHTSSTVFVGYSIISGEFAGDDVVIWTTTPWTLPSSQAVAYHDDMVYERLEVVDVLEGSLLSPGQRFWASASLRKRLEKAFGISSLRILSNFKGSELAGTRCRHPFYGTDGYEREVRLLPAKFVTDDQGTGFVHTSPDHGVDDFYLGKEHGLEPLELIGLDGKFKEGVSLFAGCAVWSSSGKEGDANALVKEVLRSKGRCYGEGRLRHQFPHSWRSKAPLITMVTAQWFISMTEGNLRGKALEAIEQTKFYPKEGQKRLHSMIRDRPDWCISRQRIWGVPLPIFVNKETGEPLRDKGVVDRTVALFRKEGADAWFERDKKDFLGSDFNSEDYEQVMDVVDVWFDSGSTHRFVLDEREDLSFPADMYLEGTDQHRGWFHSSLLESCGTRGVAPYKSVFTHGFVLDGKGRKMSKSEGNVLDPKDVFGKLGAEIMRLWVVETRYYDDIKADMAAMQKVVDIYRKFRNTLRWLLGNLVHEDEGSKNGVDSSKPDASYFSELDCYILHRVSSVNETVWQLCQDHEYLRMYRLLHEFCVTELSALYFDVSKDTLYCAAKNSGERQAALYVLRQVFEHLVRWLAPVLSFTAEEAYLCDKGCDFEKDEQLSIHRETFLKVDRSWQNNTLAEKFTDLLRVRRVVLGALELARTDGVIGSSLQSFADVYLSPELLTVVDSKVFHDLCIVSGVATLPIKAAPSSAFVVDGERDVAVVIRLAEGKKCKRCWAVKSEVGSLTRDDVCMRCHSVLDME